MLKSCLVSWAMAASLAGTKRNKRWLLSLLVLFAGSLMKRFHSLLSQVGPSGGQLCPAALLYCAIGDRGCVGRKALYNNCCRRNRHAELFYGFEPETTFERCVALSFLLCTPTLYAKPLCSCNSGAADVYRPLATHCFRRITKYVCAMHSLLGKVVP